MIRFFHHSRLARFRSPFGAAPAGSDVRIFAEHALPEGSRVLLRLFREDGTETIDEMLPAEGGASLTVRMPDLPCLVWYFFILELPDGTSLRYGGDTGEGRLYEGEPPAWQITVYHGSFRTPDPWKRGICYQIFPDRFRRSSWEDFHRRILAHTSLGRTVRVHERWSEPPEWEPAPGEKEYSPDDFFGGDLNGIREKLAYLASLGVTTLYLNPIFESSSNHRYNTADYLKIDPVLGTREDFDRLVSEAERYGIRLMLDGVFSHTGDDSLYFNREGRYPGPGAYQSKGSPYYEWYDFRAWPDDYDCWWGFKTLPNVKETTPSYQRFILGDEGVVGTWMRAPLRGWRLDVADELPDAFIRSFRETIRRRDPDSVLIGEVWEDCSNKYGPEGRRDYVDGDLLDGAMNYPLKNALMDWLNRRTDAYAFSEQVSLLWEHYPEPFLSACMNLLSSHDDIRLLYRLADCPGRNELTRAEQQGYRPSREMLALAKRRIPLAFAFMTCFPGVPTLYYGDEAGMPGMMDPFNRGPYPWGAEDREILSAAKAIFPLRRASAPLQEGKVRMGALSRNSFGLVRLLGGQGAALLVLNASDAEDTVSIAPDSLPGGPLDGVPLPVAGSWTDALTGKVLLAEDPLVLRLAPVSFRLLLRNEPGDGGQKNP